MSEPEAPSTPASWPLAELPSHWGVLMTYGVLTTGVGIVLAVWPEQSLKVCAVLVAIQLLLTGVYRVAVAAGARSLDGGVRSLLGLSGALALIVGLLCLRDPVQTVLLIGVLLGAWWLVAGVIDVLGALLSPSRERRGWSIASGLISVAIGGFLLVNPKISVGVLVIVACTYLLVIGGLAIVTALGMRRDERRIRSLLSPA